jgi:alkanesulfonate monooxygenase SsuD/methylene tetrahydromethanopterin reductase-like flavin-dependent oxidoreductase (luciferase family)
MTQGSTNASQPVRRDAPGRVGVAIQGPAPAAAVDLIVEAERAGIPAVWMTTGGTQADAITLFAAAAVRTERILFGSAIIPTWPRNAVFIAQQVQAVEGLAPGRLRLGIGPSTAAAMRPFGVDFRAPLAHLEEYLRALRSLLHEGSVDVAGEFVRARARIAQPTQTPVMASALQEGAFRLCGAIADGAISWVCPWSYIQERALPALREGAAAAGRETPPLIMHVPVCVAEDPAVVREAAQRQVGMYPRFQFYNDMFRRAGYPDAADGLSQSLVDALVVYGSEAEVAERLAERAAAGFGEVMAMPLIAGDDRTGSIERSYAAIAAAAQRAAGPAPA